MKNQLNDELVSAIRNNVSDDINIANLLINTLSMSKEAVYRRLRGDVPFTFEEVAQISSQLAISLDNIVNIKNAKQTSPHLNPNLCTINNPLDHYCENLENCIRIFQKMNKSKDSKARLAINSLPYVFYLPYPHIAKFRLYRWIYQMQAMPTIGTYEEMIVPKNVLDVEKRFITEHKQISDTTIILDHNVFKSFIGDVNYFYKLNLLSDIDLKLIKNELIQMISELETIATTGIEKTGNRINIYISNIDLESSYIHFEYEDYKESFLKVFSIKMINFQNSTICNTQKEWIDSLKRYSTLISESGEIQRIKFFNEQRNLTFRMGNI